MNKNEQNQWQKYNKSFTQSTDFLDGYKLPLFAAQKTISNNHAILEKFDPAFFQY